MFIITMRHYPWPNKIKFISWKYTVNKTLWRLPVGINISKINDTIINTDAKDDYDGNYCRVDFKIKTIPKGKYITTVISKRFFLKELFKTGNVIFATPELYWQRLTWLSHLLGVYSKYCRDRLGKFVSITVHIYKHIKKRKGLWRKQDTPYPWLQQLSNKTIKNCDPSSKFKVMQWNSPTRDEEVTY